MVAIITMLFLSYYALLWMLHSGFIKVLQQKEVVAKDDLPFLSVVVPFRNEEKNIGLLLSDLFAQRYPQDQFEILLVNDHSTDQSLQQAEAAIRASSFSNIVMVQPAGHGKKASLAEGIRQSRGSIIVTTDADCRLNSNWLESIGKLYHYDSIKLVFGPVRIESGKSIFSKMQAIEFSSLIGSGAATMAYGIPTMSNGANFSFRKNAFYEVGGYTDNAHIASGDDEFLMRKFAKKFPAGIRFNVTQESIVSTLPQPTLSTFFNQRIRWAGKWKAHQDTKSKLIALYVFIFHAMILSLPVLVFTNVLSGYLVLALLVGKALLEFKFLHTVISWLNVKWNWLAFVLLQFSYSLYAVSVGLTSNFIRSVWKQRKQTI